MVAHCKLLGRFVWLVIWLVWLVLVCYTSPQSHWDTASHTRSRHSQGAGPAVKPGLQCLSPDQLGTGRARSGWAAGPGVRGRVCETEQG
ncbi:hypothetical protein V8C86DRAFT_2542411 [Haematococcus lacustris]